VSQSSTTQRRQAIAQFVAVQRNNGHNLEEITNMATANIGEDSVKDVHDAYTAVAHPWTAAEEKTLQQAYSDRKMRFWPEVQGDVRYLKMRLQVFC